jgi:hypothetical protein
VSKLFYATPWQGDICQAHWIAKNGLRRHLCLRAVYRRSAKRLAARPVQSRAEQGGLATA